MEDVVILGGSRTAIGRFGGTLSGLSAVELGAIVIADLVRKLGISPDVIDEVLMGQVLTAGCGQNPARQAAIKAGLAQSTPAVTINHVCGSGLTSVLMATQMIHAGDADLIIAGGQENMSAAPHVLPHSRDGHRMGPWSMTDSMVQDGLWDAFNQYHMGQTAENVAEKYGITREAQDAFAATSQNKAEAALRKGHFKKEIVPVEIQQKKGSPMIFDADEGIRAGVTAASIANLKPAFNSKGSVTAANASGINDGAAAVIVASRRRAEQLGIKPMAVIRAGSHTGVDPAFMGIAPVSATQRCLKKAGWALGDLDLIEANEAFAAQSLAVAQLLEWDLGKVNVNGGAIALGHPIGASGCRVLITLLHELERRGARKGLATLCIGGGQGVALAVERA